MIKKLNKYIDDKLVRVREHPTADLKIYNYTQTVQFERKWDEVTSATRGLILNSDGDVVARPFPKFFNVEEHVSEFLDDIPNLPFEVYEKMDGSLGILYWVDDIPYIATRGSFDSEQAIKGTEMLHTMYKDSINKLDKTKTYLFEIIYAANRIVVKYLKDELVLLAIIDTETGDDCELTDIGFPLVKKYDGIKDYKQLKELSYDNKEGFVVKFSNGFRMKIKFDEYCRLHGIVTNITSYDIWDCLRNGTNLTEVLDRVPDEFYKWVQSTISRLRLCFEHEKLNANVAYQKILYKFNERGGEWTDKEFAYEAKKSIYVSLLFTLKKGKSIDEALWKMCKPAYEKPFYNINLNED